MSEKEKILLGEVSEFTAEKTDAWPGDDSNTANVLDERRTLSEPLTDEEASRRMFLRSLAGFAVGGVSAATAFFGWRWLSDETRSNLYQSAFRLNERVGQIFYRPTRLSPEFPSSQISPPRVNGSLGMEGEIEQSTWTLAVGGLANRTDDLILTLDDIKRLPRVEMTTELKCIEGWSVIVQWAGARFADFASAYPPQTIDRSQPDVINRPQELVPYVSIATPDEQYFVGWDMQSILHPQTLLAYEMNGEPLKPEHGAPLRIASPTKYGIKLIKRIGRIEFTSEKPRDYWAESGYDWYSGH